MSSWHESAFESIICNFYNNVVGYVAKPSGIFAILVSCMLRIVSACLFGVWGKLGLFNLSSIALEEFVTNAEPEMRFHSYCNDKSKTHTPMRAENPHSCLEYYHYRGYNIEVKKDVGSSNECQSLCEKLERCKYYTCTSVLCATVSFVVHCNSCHELKPQS